jgi:hypothetical protein
MSIDCNQFANVALECKGNIGGAKKLWVGAYDGFSYTLSGTTGAEQGLVIALTTGLVCSEHF